MNKLLFAAAVLFLSHSAAANQFKYRIRDVGALWPAQCNAKAAELGERFETYTGKRVLSSRCEVDSILHETDFTLIYESEKPLLEVTTSQLTPVGTARGIYSTAEKCQARLPDHVALFERETGLEAFFSFCRQERYVHPNPWSIHIDAFGETKREPIIGYVRMDSAPRDKSMGEIYAELKKGLTDEGATLDWLTLRTSSPLDALVFLYYAEKRVPVAGHRVTGGLSAGVCAEAKPRWADAFRAAGGRAFTLFCGTRSAASKTSELWVMYLDVSAPRFSVAEEAFSGYADCVAQRPALEEKYRAQYGWPITGSICGWDERQKMKLSFVEKMR